MRRGPVSLLALAAILTCAAPAAAQETGKRDRRGDVPARGLNGSERRAMDIARVTASWTDRGLLIVDVRLAGNVERRLGRGHLRRGGVGIGLRPSRGRRTAVVTTGSGARASGAKKGPGTAVVVDRQAGLVRFILTGVRRPARIIAIAFSRPPRRARARRAQAVPNARDAERMLEALFRTEVGQHDSHEAEDYDWAFLRAIGLRGEPTCGEWRRIRTKLEAERSVLVGELGTATTPAERRRIEVAINTLDVHLDHVRRKIEECARLPAPLPEEFSVSWAHGGSGSRMCVYVTGPPGRTGDVTVVADTREFTLGNSGRATVMIDIPGPGNYPIRVRWRQPDGSFQEREGTFRVEAGQGPPPPDGFSPCPPPA
jgi:hypothetical protein